MHISSQLKWAKSIPVIRLNCCFNHTLWGSTYLFSLYKGVHTVQYPPAPGLAHHEHFQTLQHGQYLTHSGHSHITLAVAAMDSCHALIGVHQHGKMVRPCFPFLLIYLHIKRVEITDIKYIVRDYKSVYIGIK